MYGAAFVWLIAVIMSGNHTSNKETSKQIHRQTADNNAGRLLRHVLSHPRILLRLCSPDSTPFIFAFISLLLLGGGWGGYLFLLALFLLIVADVS